MVIVDNGSEDDTQSVIERFRPQFTQELLTYFEPRAGLGNARNRGWTTATGDIIAFTDDDCYPTEDFLEAVTRCFEEDDRLGFVGGRILLYDETDYRITIQEKMSRQEIAPGEFIPAGLIQGANFACRRSALESIGGFDGIFGVGSLFACEEIDVLARMSARGWHGAFDPRPVVYHHHGRKTQIEVARLMKVYDRGRGAYYAKCLLNPVLRVTYLRKWCGYIKRQPLPQTCRELIAGGEFLVRAALQRGHPAVSR
jgi:GT2 family glycosyltransferase